MTNSGDIIKAKRALRRAMGDALKAMDPGERDRLSRALTERVLDLEAVKTAGTVMLYAGTAHEPDTLPLIQALLDRGARVCLPVVRSKEHMEAGLIDDLAALAPGVMGILEPTGTAVCPPEEIDVILVPGVAFDARGGRLGHGAGYYDRFLRRTHAVTIALAFDRQMVDRVPTNARDVRLNFVATERALYGGKRA